MHVALNEKLAALPNDTKVYCGHEYTASKCVTSLGRFVGKSEQLTEICTGSVAFSAKVDPENAAIQKLVQFCKVRLARFRLSIIKLDCSAAQENSVTTGKFTIGDEKEHNVFMRTSSPAVQSEPPRAP